MKEDTKEKREEKKKEKSKMPKGILDFLEGGDDRQ